MTDNPFLKVMSDITPQTMFGMKSVKGDVGLELELEGTGPLGETCKGWVVHQENSLRGPGGIGHGGVEYVTVGAISENDVIPAVEALQTKLAKAGVQINQEAHRSSTHVHINVQQMKLINIFGYLTVFTCIEPMLLALCGERRDGNSFCASSYETGDLPEYFNEAFKSIEKYSHLGESQRGKYASLSTFRLHDLGTLECRCFPQSIDPQEVAKWVRWLLNLRSIVCLEDDKSFRQIVKQGIHDPLTLAQRVFNPDGTLYIPLSQNLQRELVSFGSQEAYELTRLIKRYINKKPEEKKKKENLYNIVANAGWAGTPRAELRRSRPVFAPIPEMMIVDDLGPEEQ